MSDIFTRCQACNKLFSSPVCPCGGITSQQNIQSVQSILTENPEPEPTKIYFSGDVVTWPAFVCPCCLKNSEGGECWISHQSSTGERVVHSRLIRWTIPYCSTCLKHATIYTEAKRGLNSINPSNADSASFTCGCLSFVSFLIALVYFNAIVSTIVMICVAAVLVTTIPAIKKSEEIRVSKMKEFFYNKIKEAEDIRSQSCCGRGFTVHYNGKEGRLHMFSFKNEDYLTRFRQLNGKHILSDNQVPCKTIETVDTSVRDASIALHQTARALNDFSHLLPYKHRRHRRLF